MLVWCRIPSWCVQAEMVLFRNSLPLSVLRMEMGVRVRFLTWLAHPTRWSGICDFLATGRAHVRRVSWSTIVRLYRAPPLQVVLKGPMVSMLTVDRILEWG